MCKLPSVAPGNPTGGLTKYSSLPYMNFSCTRLTSSPTPQGRLTSSCISYHLLTFNQSHYRRDDGVFTRLILRQPLLPRQHQDPERASTNRRLAGANMPEQRQIVTTKAITERVQAITGFEERCCLQGILPTARRVQMEWFGSPPPQTYLNPYVTFLLIPSHSRQQTDRHP